MAENNPNPMESFKEKLTGALQGDNKAEGIMEAVMDLLRAHGAAVPDIALQKVATGKAAVDNDAVVGAFTKKIHAAIKGEHQADNIKKAVNELLRAYGISIQKQKPEYYKHPVYPRDPKSPIAPKPNQEPEKKPYYTNPPVQVGYMRNIGKN
jgi:hypothetical protein